MSDVEAGPSSQARTGTQLLAAAREAARSAAARAGVTVAEVEDMPSLREAAALFGSVWGVNEEGVPVSSEVMRSLVHAGGATTVARDGSGALVGAAVLTPAAPPGSTYSLIAAVAPGSSDRGIGLAVKQQQRAWALAAGFDRMSWTFDPLVSRNARFNLVRLGALARQYVVGFYGVMEDAINGRDESDRLVATWELATQRVAVAASGVAPEPAGPAADAEPLAAAPDGGDLVRRDAAGLWLRVPADVVALRRSDPEQAARWRFAAREVLHPALGRGAVATHMTRDGWYLIT